MQQHEVTDWKRALELYRDLVALEPAERARAIDRIDASPTVRAMIDQMAEVANKGGIASVIGRLDPLIESLGTGEPSPAGQTLPDESLIGRAVGDWVLVRTLGQGGMASVYVAERRGVGFRQQGALKLLSLLMMATGGSARFNREQQFLARMQHPNIAMLLDGGVAQDGTPFLVTELVSGLHIREYCLERSLSARDIVRLLLQVCAAVSHAHGHLVLHRDIKPSNVMITEDGQAKLLDFGIAKLVSDAADGTQTRIFTPKYAAPEQLSGGMVTTATDVHGLGVLGRILLGDRTGHQRELSRILDMATRDEPQRRYSSVESLSRDLRNWLENRPIAAADDSFVYRSRKFLRRHRGPALATAAIALTAFAGMLAVLWQAQQTRQQLATAERTTEFLVQLFEEADPAVAKGSPTTARELLTRARTTLETIDDERLRDQLVLAIAQAYQGMGDYADARDLLMAGLSVPIASQSVDAQLLLANAAYLSGRADEPIALLENISPRASDAARVHSLLGKYLSSDGQFERADREHAAALGALGNASPMGDRITVQRNISRNHIRQARYSKAIESLDLALSLSKEAEVPLQEAEIEQMLAQVANIQGRHQDALAHSARARDLFGRIYDEEHSIMIGLARQEADTLRSMGDHAGAVEKLEQAAVLARRRLGDSTETTNVLNFLSMAYGGIGRLDEAVATGLETSEILVRTGDARHPIRGNVLGNVASYLVDLGQLDAAQSNLQIARDILSESLPAEHPVSIFVEYQTQRAAIGRGKHADALQRLLELAPMAMQSPGPGNGLTLSILCSVGRQSLRLGNPVQAIEWFGRCRQAASSKGQDNERYLDASADLAEAMLAAGQRQKAVALMQQVTRVKGSHGADFEAGMHLREARFALAAEDQQRARDLARSAMQVMQNAPKAATTWAPELAALTLELKGVGRE